MKAVLVIDVDEKDIGRKVNYISVQGGGMSYIVGNIGDDIRLRPLPQKMTMEKALKMERDGAIKDIYTTWNACLDAITGETE